MYTYLRFGQKYKNLAAKYNKTKGIPIAYLFPLQKKGNYFILTLDRLSDLPHAHCISTTLLLTAYLYQSHWIKRMSDFFRYVPMLQQVPLQKPFYSARKKIFVFIECNW